MVPKAVVTEVIELASDKVRRENSSRAELMKGAYLRDVYEKYGVLLSDACRPHVNSAPPALPLEARAVRAKLDQAAVLHFRDVRRPPVRTAKADIRRQSFPEHQFLSEPCLPARPPPPYPFRDA